MSYKVDMKIHFDILQRMDSSGSGDQHYLRSSQSPSRRVLGPSSAANEPEASADGSHVFRAPNPVGKKRNSLSDSDHQVTPSRDLRRVSCLERFTAVISHMGIGFEHAVRLTARKSAHVWYT